MPRPLHQTPVLPSPSDPLTPQSHPHDQPIFHHSGRNVISLLSRREISPKTKHLSKRRWGEPKGSGHSSFGLRNEAAKDAKRGLISWVEEESLWKLSAEYSPLMPPPRSTIAAAFSTDGRTLASTHGDHTVKIIDSRTGRCLKVLSGHRRTPWVVRFHPIHPEIVASGSLDHEVRLWDTNTSECIGSRDFLRPIASLAFHAKGEFLAVASGHKLYLWHYNRKGETSSPTVLLKTKRSLRAVHFHPHGAPYLLTAEVNELDYSDPSIARATSLSYLHYPPPSVFLTTAHSSGNLSLSTEHSLMSLPFMFLPSFARDEMTIESLYSNRPVDSTRIQAVLSAPVPIEAEFSAPVPVQAELHAVEQYDCMQASPVVLSNPYPATGSTEVNQISHRNESSLYEVTVDAMETTEVHPEMGTLSFINNVLPATSTSGLESIEVERPHQFIPSIVPTRWELPFFQGWLSGQSQSTMNPVTSGTSENLSSYPGVDSGRLTPDMSTYNIDIPVASSAIPGSNILGINGRSGFGHRFPHSGLIPVSESEQGLPSFRSTRDMIDHEPIINRIQSELATSLAEAAAAAETPCTVNLRIWSHDIKSACVPLSADRCKLSIPHAVLCSEMGAHFSPCGRYLAACVACTHPNLESDYGLQTQVNQDILGTAASSPTRHPIPAHPVMFELRIYSLEKATFGSVLVSRAIRAAHCLTSIQFSPTSEHILLAYGRRHSSLLKSIVIDGETPLPIYTILEVYRVSDMEVVRVIPSAEDEVNVACFHPLAGGGLVYGTKEGKLRILQYDGGVHVDSAESNLFLEENMAEVQTYALEC